MLVELSPEALRAAQAAVDSGRFRDITEAVNEAVCSYLDEDLLAALQEAEDAIERGDVCPFTSELLEKITQEAISDSKMGKPIDPRVLP